VMLATLLLMPELSYTHWKGLFSGTLIRVLTLLAMLALCWHAWIGVRDIYMDYIKPTAVRLTLQVMTIVLLAGYAIWAINILWSI